MGFSNLLDHTAKVWRPTESHGALRTVVQTFALVSTVRVAVNRPTRAGSGAMLADLGPGLKPTGQRILYATAGWDIQTRDVIELTAGPDSPGRFEVDEPPTRPRGHHLELRCRYWAGVLPGDT